MVNNRERVREAIESTYDGICSIYEYKSVRGDDGIIRQKEEAAFADIPCKLSYETNYPVRQTDTAAVVSQRVKLFIAPEVNVKSGSKVIVERLGEKAEYAFSGEAAIYPTHREIRLSPFLKRT